MTIKNYWVDICDECGAENTFELYRLIDQMSDPYLKQKILDHNLFEFTCPNCLYEFVNTYDVVYHNPESNFVVAFFPSEPDIEPEEDEVLYMLQKNARDSGTYYLRHPYITDDWDDFRLTIKKYSGTVPLHANQRNYYEELAQKDPVAFFTLVTRDQMFRKHSLSRYFSESIIAKYNIADLVIKRKKEEFANSLDKITDINDLGELLRSLTADVSSKTVNSEDGTENKNIEVFRIPDSDNPWGGEVYDLERNRYRKIMPLPAKSKLESFNRLRFLDEGSHSAGLKPDFNTEAITLLKYPGASIPERSCFFRASEIEDKFDVFGNKETISFYDCLTGNMLCQLSLLVNEGAPEIYYYIYNAKYFGKCTYLLDSTIDFMFRTYILNETVPCPVFKSYRDNYDAMCDYAFSLFGRKGIYGKIFTSSNYYTNISADVFLNYILPIFHNVNTHVIDVRTREEYSSGHIEGSINLDIGKSDYKNELCNLDTRSVWYTISNENKRAVIAKEIMDKLGFEMVHDIKGGYKQWKGKLSDSDK